MYNLKQSFILFMTSTAASTPLEIAKARRLPIWLTACLTGALMPLGFAPFHFPGLSILGIALFYLQLQQDSKIYSQQLGFRPGETERAKGVYKQYMTDGERDCNNAENSSMKRIITRGFAFGLGYFGIGVSWVYVSIHAYGHLHPLLAALLTFSFITYLSCYFILLAFLFKKLTKNHPSKFFHTLCFSALWISLEYARSTWFTGFPWLLIGIGQFDAPAKALIPILGIYGTGFITCLAATWLAHAMQPEQRFRIRYLSAGLILLLSPNLLKPYTFIQESPTAIPTAIVQSNISMRDKWDEHLFWSILDYYQTETHKLLGTPLIVLPESSIPLPASYVHDYLEQLETHAYKKGSAILLGIPSIANTAETHYYNTLLSLGHAKGYYIKKHLVPFGEYMPSVFNTLSRLLNYPVPNIKPGPMTQKLMQVQGHPIATLICYELAYDKLLRAQLPQASFIVSVSDDGWFGHSLAMYQQQQIAQVRSLQTGRYQVVSNNDGLSAVLNTQGDIIAALPVFSRAVLKANVKPATGMTPWVKWGDLPIFICISLILLFCLLLPCTLRRYPYQPD